MRQMLCNLSLSLLSPPPSPPLNFRANIRSVYKTLIRTAVTVSLSLTLTISPPLSFAVDSPLSTNQPPPSSPSSDWSKSFFDSSENCVDEYEEEDGGPQQRDDGFVTSEAIVQEAWQIVNDSFLGTGGRPWSPETWQKKKEDILATSIQTRSMAHDVIRRMLASLGDPYTRFLSPAELSKMSKYDITGIGINLREVPDSNGHVKLKVLGLILDGPADSAGVRQGDEVLAVDGVDVSGKSAFEVSSLLQGPSKSFVELKVKHGNCGPVRSIKVQRQLNARTPVFYRLEQNDNGRTAVGYIRLKEFNALARKDLVIAMKRLQDMGASYFVMDLRDNLGGLVQAGMETAKLFLEDGETVTYTAGRDPQSQNTIVADASPLITAPVIVLVNNKTASASEIVASALHDNCRAVLVGQRTFGKGLIQSVFELRDGSGIVVTIGKYITPNHMDINGNGIEPDYRNLPAWNEVKEHLSKCNMLRRS